MRRWSWVVLASVVVGVVVWAVWPDGADRTNRVRTRELATELRCPDCEGLSVFDSSTSTARAIRTDIRRRIEAGASDEEIRQSYVDRYGESILLNPEGEGLGVLVWGLPVLVLLVAGAGLALALRRWRAQPAMRSTDADETLVARERRASG